MDGLITQGALSLGRRLASEFDETDLLGRWMCHHLSGLLREAAEADGHERRAAEHRAADLVLRIWKHKAATPFRQEPVAGIDAVTDGLARLGSQPDPWSQSRQARRGEATPPADQTHLYEALRLADELDTLTGRTLSSLFYLAGQAALEDAAPWAEDVLAASGMTEWGLERFMSFVSRRRSEGGGFDAKAQPERAVSSDLQMQARALRDLAAKIETLASAPTSR